jgi:hypothetical protein
MPRAVEVGSNIHEPPFGFGVKMRDSIRLLVLFSLASFLGACANDGKNIDSAHGGEHDSDVAQLIDSGEGTSGETGAADSAGGENVAADGEETRPWWESDADGEGDAEGTESDSDGERSEHTEGDSDGEGSEHTEGDSDGDDDADGHGDHAAAAEAAAAE